MTRCWTHRYSKKFGEFVRVTLPIKGPITPYERAWLKDPEQGGTLEPVERLLLVHAARREPVIRVELRGGKLFDDGELIKAGESTMARRLTNAEARKATKAYRVLTTPLQDPCCAV